MFRRSLTTAAVTGLTSVLLAAPALAAPPASNPQLDSFPVTCGNETLLVSAPQKSSGAAVFGPDGHVHVAQNFAGTFEGTLTVESTGEVVEGGSSFEGRPKGIDPARLVTCTFTESFTEEVVVDTDLLDELGVPERTDLLGEAGTLAGTFIGTVGVLMPGRR